MVISGFEQLKQHSRPKSPVPAVVAAAHDAHTLEGVLEARRDGLIAPILVGRSQEIRSIVRALGGGEGMEVLEADSDEAAARRSVELIRSGRGRMLIKGLLPTGTLLKAVVNSETGIRKSEVMSHVAILDVPAYPKLLFITDGGMVVAPGLEEKRHILRNCAEFCRFLGYEQPKAAVLCAVETVNSKMAETLDAAQLKKDGQAGLFGPCLVEGPISFDLATDPKAAVIKGYESPVAGDADILLVPSITGGNFIGKALYGMAGGEMAGVVLGAQVPITINSRGATPEEKYYSILISAAMAADRR